MKKINYIITTIPFLKDLFEIIYSIKTNMDYSIDSLELLTKLSISIILGYLIFLINKLHKKIKILDEHYSLNQENIDDAFSVHNAIYKRKLQYLYKCIKYSKILPEPQYLTDLEKNLLSKSGEKRKNQMDELAKNFET